MEEQALRTRCRLSQGPSAPRDRLAAVGCHQCPRSSCAGPCGDRLSDTPDRCPSCQRGQARGHAAGPSACLALILPWRAFSRVARKKASAMFRRIAGWVGGWRNQCSVNSRTHMLQSPCGRSRQMNRVAARCRPFLRRSKSRFRLGARDSTNNPPNKSPHSTGGNRGSLGYLVCRSWL